MSTNSDAKWLEWVRELQALAQTGLAYSADPFDIQRFEAVRRVSAEIAAAHTDTPMRQIERLFTQQSGYATPKVGTRGAIFRPGLEGKPTPSLETSDVDWFPQHALPDLAVNKVAPEEVDMAFRFHLNPSLRTAFD